MKLLGSLIFLLLTARLTCARDNSLLPQEAQDGWILLFDGESLFGWTPEGGAQWGVANGEILAQAGESGYLRTNSAFADFILRCDFRIKAEGESGIFLRIAKDGKPQDTGYKLQINNKDPNFPTGSLVNQLKATNAQAGPGQWHSVEVEAVGNHFLVRLDGKPTVNGEARKSKMGYIGLQFASTPVEFRNVKIKPLSLQPIFNGQNLYEWKPVSPPPEPKKKGIFKKLIGGGGGKPPEWSVQDGAIHINKGPSQLESNSLYDDFILRLGVRTDARNKNGHPSGGVFLRAEKGVLSTGYKVQIHSEYQGGDRTKPVDYGTGGLYAIRPARRIVSDDNQFFTQTVVARSHHIAVWVNGYPVSDYEDVRPEGADALIQARSGPGTISLEAHDAESSLEFKNIQITTLPKGGAPASETVATAPSASSGAPGAAPPTAPSTPYSLPSAANPHEKEIRRLTDRALRSSDPGEQVGIYDRILELDPNNLVAYNARKDAQEKVDKAKAEKTQQEAEIARQEEENKKQKDQAHVSESTKREALKQAEEAFLAGNLTTAMSEVAIAKKIDPNDLKVQRLGSLIGRRARAERIRTYVLYGLGVLIPGGFLALLILSRGKKDAYLEIVDGLDRGKRYNVDQDVIHIGAVAQDGGSKNEIVVQDVERTISRFHCEIHRQNGKFYVLDCDSANGTYLDGKRVAPGTPVRLKGGSRVELAEACALRLGFEKRK